MYKITKAIQPYSKGSFYVVRNLATNEVYMNVSMTKAIKKAITQRGGTDLILAKICTMHSYKPQYLIGTRLVSEEVALRDYPELLI